MSATHFLQITSEDRQRYHEKDIEFRNLPIKQGRSLASGRGKLMILTDGTKGLADIFVDEWFGDHEKNARYHLSGVAFRSITAVGSAFLLDCSGKA
jgi:hypothetical protein